MVDLNANNMETDPAKSSLANDNTVNDDSGATDNSVVAGNNTQSEGQAAGAVDQVASEGKAESEAVGKSDGAEEKRKAANGEAKKENPTTLDSLSKTAAVNGKSGANSHGGDTGDKRSGHKRGGYQGGKKFEDYRKNVKTDFTAQKESDDPVEIRKQVEFYFSDANLATDKFLLEKVGGSANNAVPISVLHSFKRMRHFQPFSAVVAALKESTVLDVLDDESVKRKVPLDDTFNEKSIEEVQKVYETAAMARSVYVKGFGDETPSTQFDIEAFFAPYGPTNVIRLRRTTSKVFKGSVFVEFDSEQTQEAFLSLDPKPQWKGADLIVKSKKRYCDEKVDDIQAGKIRRNSPDRRDDRDWRVRRDEDRKGGFRDDRNKGGNRGSGRGRGRGRGGRDNSNRDRERFDKTKKPRDEHTVPAIATSTAESAGEVPPAESPETSKKRTSEVDEDGDEHGDMKRADLKPQIDTSKSDFEVASKSSLKREREGDDGDEGQGAAKKVDAKEGGS